VRCIQKGEDGAEISISKTGMPSHRIRGRKGPKLLLWWFIQWKKKIKGKGERGSSGGRPVSSGWRGTESEPGTCELEGEYDWKLRA